MSSRPAEQERRAGWQRWTMDTLEPGRSVRTQSGLATVAELEQLHDQASREGRKEGYAQGRAEGRAAAALEAARLETLVGTMESACVALREDIADDVLTLALDIARQVLQEALPVKRDLLLPVVREAIQGLPAASQGAQIQLNPADVELVRAHFGEELRINSWQIVEDHRIQPGGCRLASPHGEVDATLATRWKRVIATLGRDNAWIAS
jgi:flagellar assembly protein FliH